MNIAVKSNRLKGLFQNDWPVVVIMVVMLPSFYWIAIDHHIWPWDQALYGDVSVDLWFKITRRISGWWPAMLGAFGAKAPGIAWFGQFFVPLGQAMGSIETGLLCSVLATQIGSLFFAWKIAEEFAPGKRLVACVGILVFASAPLFVAMSHQYLTEPLQLFGVTYFYFLAARGHRMLRVTLLGNLLLATAIAMLGKATSPIYCALPGLIATRALFQKRDPRNEVSRKEVFWGWFCVFAGLVLCAMCAKWYLPNLAPVMKHVEEDMSLEVTINYGRAGTFFQKIRYWFTALQCSFQLPWVLIGQLILLGVGVAASRRRFGRDGISPDALKAPLNLLAISSVIHILGVISLCSLNYEEENRFLLSLLPAVATIDLWLVRKIRSPWLLAGVIALFCYQWAAVCAYALGLTASNPRISYWVIPFDRNRAVAREVARVVQRTSNADTNRRTNIVGVDLPWLNLHTLRFFAAKAQLKSGARCSYDSLGYAEKNVEAAWALFDYLKPVYFISLEETAQPASPDFLNGVSISILRRVRSDSSFIREPFSSKLGVVIFRKDVENSKAAMPVSSGQ
jgi:hypothetical protein